MSKWMCIRYAVISFVIWALTIPFAKSQISYEHQYIVKVGDTAPDFNIALTNGKNFQLSKQKGKLVMLQFTASWCGVCRKEMPHIENEIWQKLKTNDDFVLIGVDYKEDKKKAMKFSRQMNISYPMAVDDKGLVFHLFAEEGAGVTRNVIIDKNGKIIFLTRLYKTKEFNEMKNIIFKELSK